jgi:hypothetical protein
LPATVDNPFRLDPLNPGAGLEARIDHQQNTGAVRFNLSDLTDQEMRAEDRHPDLDAGVRSLVNDDVLLAAARIAADDIGGYQIKLRVRLPELEQIAELFDLPAQLTQFGILGQ